MVGGSRENKQCGKVILVLTKFLFMRVLDKNLVGICGRLDKLVGDLSSVTR
jgi:hypothetical protein